MEELEKLIKEIAKEEGIQIKDAIKLTINLLRINQANQPDKHSAPINGSGYLEG
ncbi:hypothetical protein [Proteus terrae]|uniref:hypothetical protein n=1 Tax=Proteus terrae TaxID=1574161 RepID=UPI0013DFCB0D|nr:hypothetical protein [Proteus terrae]QIF97646.1 hypothetical protein GTH25_06095 [Proteus terrae subsp. cibarius]